jgi:predicted dienelactone hydrolase
MNFRVGLRRLLYEDMGRKSWDSDRPRPLSTDVWYPALDTAVERDIFIGPPDMPLFYAGRAGRDPDLASAPDRFPLILLSHGTGGLSLQIGWLAETLASRGYIAAAVNHHGNNGLEPYLAQGFLHYWERPRDLTVVLDQLLADPVFGPRIDPNCVGAAGFSLGGYTVIALAGGIASVGLLIDEFRKLGPDIETAIPPEFSDHSAFMKEFESLSDQTSAANTSYRDQRIKAVFALAPVLGPAFSPAGLSSINIPVKIVVGAADRSAPAAGNASHFARYIKTAELTILEKVGHYTFLAEATEAGKRELPMLCLDEEGVDRALIHQMVAGWAVEFFDKNMKV